MCMTEMKLASLTIFREKSDIYRLSQPTPCSGERRMRSSSGCKQLRVVPYPAWQDCRPSFSLPLHTPDIAKLNLLKFMGCQKMAKLTFCFAFLGKRTREAGPRAQANKYRSHAYLHPPHGSLDPFFLAPRYVAGDPTLVIFPCNWG
jgi:hypothetical protein